MKRYILAFVLILSLVSPASAQVRWKRADLFLNTGGLNNAFSPIAIEVNEAADLQNVVISTGGSVLTRDGFSSVNSPRAITATGLKFYEPTSGDRFLVGVFENDTILKMDYTSGGGLDGTYDDITGSLTFSRRSDSPNKY